MTSRFQLAEAPAPSLSLVEGPVKGARIKVVGIGGGGCNAIDRMIGSGIKGVEFIAANTDLQALRLCSAPVKLQLGAKLTNGLGAGANPEIGRQAALEDTEKIIDLLEGSDMVFVTAGLGGGTGSGGAPIVANLATELGTLTVAVVTRPFAFEGRRRAEQSDQALADLRQSADTVITIPNERLLSTLPPDTTFADGFTFADDVLRQAVQGISDLITIPGAINLDFADVETIMKEMGMALMGTGVGEGDNRALSAARKAILSPLLEDTTIEGARGVLINVSGSQNITLHEVNEATQVIRKSAHPDANIIFGSVFDESLGDKIKITVIATGFVDDESSREQEELTTPSSSEPVDSEPESDALPSHLYQQANFDNLELEIPPLIRKKSLS